MSTNKYKPNLRNDINFILHEVGSNVHGPHQGTRNYVFQGAYCGGFSLSHKRKELDDHWENHEHWL
jgi:hypothetical protein